MPLSLMIKRLTILGGILFLIGNSLWAQQSETQDVLYLLDGSVLVGTLLEYKKGEEVTFQLKNGETLKIADEEVDRLVQKSVNAKARGPIRMPMEKGKLYHAVFISANAGTNFLDGGDWGLGIEALSGITITDELGLGLGTGLQQYSADVAWRVVPVFLDVRLKSNTRSPWVLNGDVGIGFPLENENHNIIGTKAGERFRLGIGKILTSHSSAHFIMEFAYHYQRGEFTSNTWNWSNEDFIARDIKFRRWQLRFGVIF